MSSPELCPFCTLPESRIVAENAHGLVIRDAYPVSPGHTLVIPKRHMGSFFELTPAERSDLLALLDQAREELQGSLHPDGFNIGINDGPAAGQTVPHLHIHLIPRYRGDQTDPRGGVRWIFPDKADYWSHRDGPADA
jgi:diadenosine tetraphosphate (Ap4A) HIT family hydrolase